ncbi:MAG: hypothetical protein IJU56_08920 [Clostridia bacterium]|nr:hypothetical protein [Clostridia bacterium]
MKDWEYRNMQEKIAADQTDRILTEMRDAEHRSKGTGSAASSSGAGIPKWFWWALFIGLQIFGAYMGAKLY